MDRQQKLLWVAVLALAVAGFSRTPNPKRWEYRVCRVCFLGDVTQHCELNLLGAEGWELVAAMPGPPNTLARVFLKREVP